MSDFSALSVAKIFDNKAWCFSNRLRIGWCVKAELYEKYGCKPKPLSDSEQEAISSVIKRAEALEKQEQERIG